MWSSSIIFNLKSGKASFQELENEKSGKVIGIFYIQKKSISSLNKVNNLSGALSG